MGPRSGERGNSVPRNSHKVLAALQWGRAQVSAEMPTVTDIMTLGIGASMGPRSGERGNEFFYCTSPIRHEASMGPRSGERGNMLPFATYRLVR